MNKFFQFFLLKDGRTDNFVYCILGICQSLVSFNCITAVLYFISTNMKKYVQPILTMNILYIDYFIYINNLLIKFYYKVLGTIMSFISII